MVSNQSPHSFLNSYFAEKVCINLARRPERWIRSQEEFRLHGLTSVHRFDACDGTVLKLPDGWDYGQGSYGCLRSHTSVVSAAREKGSPSILILEDDVEFHPDLDALFRQYAEQIPPDWDALLFGGLHRAPPEPVSPNIVRLKESSSTYAIAIRHTLYDAFLEINRNTMIAVDENNHILQQNFKFYGFMPHLAWVRRDYSDVMDAEVNPWWLQYSVVLFGPEQERILRGVGVIVFFDSRSFKSRAEAERDVELLQSVLRLYMAVVQESAICVIERGDQALRERHRRICGVGRGGLRRDLRAQQHIAGDRATVDSHMSAPSDALRAGVRSDLAGGIHHMHLALVAPGIRRDERAHDLGGRPALAQQLEAFETIERVDQGLGRDGTQPRRDVRHARADREKLGGDRNPEIAGRLVTGDDRPRHCPSPKIEISAQPRSPACRAGWRRRGGVVRPARRRSVVLPTNRARPRRRGRAA